MFNLPKKIVVFDTEFTAWEGSLERDWRGEDEYREIVQIGAVIVETDNFDELDSFSVFVKPKVKRVKSALPISKLRETSLYAASSGGSGRG